MRQGCRLTFVAVAYSRAPTGFGVSGPASASLMTSTSAWRSFGFFKEDLQAARSGQGSGSRATELHAI